MIFEKTVQKKKDGKTYKNGIDFINKKFLLDIFTEKPKPTKKETQKESKKD